MAGHNSYNSIYLIVFLFIIFLLFFLKNKKDSSKSEEKETEIIENSKIKEDAFHKREYIFTYSENKFFKLLNDEIKKYNGKYLVFPKIRLWDIIELNCKDDIINRNKIRSKHIDYTIVSSDNFSPVLCIELQDKTHFSKKRKNRDQYVSNSLHTAGIPSLFIRPKQANSSYLQNVLPDYLQ